ncbi:MAG: hypothetical protein K6G88_11005 [Lachnospiraceae bacterium]|nr:hypothetical protein [Lachnospiraceae bacterium]
MMNIIYIIAKIDKNTDPFTYLNDTSMTDNPTIISLLQSTSGLLMTIGLGGGVLSLMWYAIKKLLGSGSERNDAKDVITNKIFMLAGISGFTFFCGVAKMAADALIK